MKDDFKDKAQNWDKSSPRVNGAKTIAEAMYKKINFHSDMLVMDFGVGTGLLGFEILPRVKNIIGVDTSLKMLEKLKEKNTQALYIEPRNVDICKTPLNEKFDGVISSMTLHHVEDLDNFFTTLHRSLKANSFIAFADLEKEDGTFHSDNTGVFHFGFEKEELSKIVKNAGFTKISFENINTINKPHRDFGVFLLTAKK